MNSKIQLIKSKCMNVRPKIGKSESRKTSNSVCNELNDSIDEDSLEDKEPKKVSKVHLIRSIFPNRPPTVFFKYPKCCGI